MCMSLGGLPVVAHKQYCQALTENVVHDGLCARTTCKQHVIQIQILLRNSVNLKENLDSNQRSLMLLLR